MSDSLAGGQGTLNPETDVCQMSSNDQAGAFGVKTPGVTSLNCRLEIISRSS
jgi:hypothetical protein